MIKIKDYDIILRGHHLVVLCHFCFISGENYIREIMFRDGHSEEHTNYTMAILKKIKESKELKIIIVDMPDDICEKCDEEIRKSSCYDSGDDLKVIAGVDLRVCEVYTSEEILKKLEEAYLKNKLEKLEEAGRRREVKMRQTNLSLEQLVKKLNEERDDHDCPRCLIINEIGEILIQEDSMGAEAALRSLLSSNFSEDKFLAFCWLSLAKNLEKDTCFRLEKFKADPLNSGLIRVAEEQLRRRKK